MLLTDFDYRLPPELIAQSPLPDRAASRLLHLQRSPGTLTDRRFRDLPALLRPHDLLVFNDTRVIPARLFGHRSGTRTQPISPRNPAARAYLTGKVEVLLTKQLSEWEWEALVRPGRKLGIGERITFSDQEEHGALVCEIVTRAEFGERVVRFDPVPDFFARLQQIGHVPLPPYISHDDEPADRERYQTVFARHAGSAAAPTAGLHFTPDILADIKARGIETAEITLHVGLGTFQPLRDPVVEKNRLHRERYQINAVAADQLDRALRDRRRIVAVGTTATRTLEYAALLSGITPDSPGSLSRDALSGEVDLFIYPPYRFRMVGALLTNFHLPQSSLLMLVSAFAGREFVLDAYAHAVAERYRFFSYGDCMFVE